MSYSRFSIGLELTEPMCNPRTAVEIISKIRSCANVSCMCHLNPWSLFFNVGGRPLITTGLEHAVLACHVNICILVVPITIREASNAKYSNHQGPKKDRPRPWLGVSWLSGLAMLPRGRIEDADHALQVRPISSTLTCSP